MDKFTLSGNDLQPAADCFCGLPQTTIVGCGRPQKRMGEGTRIVQRQGYNLGRQKDKE